MNAESQTLEQRLLALLQAVRDTQDEAARATLNSLLLADASARKVMARLLVDEQAIVNRLRDDSIVSLLNPTPTAPLARSARTRRWLAWRPLTAAAAGILFGMLCTSVVYGFVTQRVAVVKKIPLTIYNPGLENTGCILSQGLPKGTSQWGADSAVMVQAENGVVPLEGKNMLRLDPFIRKDHYLSRAYQVIDLRTLAGLGIAGDTEVQVTASFFAANDSVASRYLIRAIALDETPEQAVRDFWTKADSDGVVSAARRFRSEAGDRKWHRFSLKMPLPRDAQSLVFILGAGPLDRPSGETSPHYLDDVQVSMIAP